MKKPTGKRSKVKTNGQKAWATRKRNLKNQFTGKPRHWVCMSHTPIDGMLEAIEALFTNSYRNGLNGSRNGLGTCGGLDPKTADAVAESFESLAGCIRKCQKAESEARSEVELTPEAQRYCELEGIDPKEFLERKRSMV